MIKRGWFGAVVTIGGQTNRIARGESAPYCITLKKVEPGGGLITLVDTHGRRWLGVLKGAPPKEGDIIGTAVTLSRKRSMAGNRFLNLACDAFANLSSKY